MPCYQRPAGVALTSGHLRQPHHVRSRLQLFIHVFSLSGFLSVVAGIGHTISSILRMARAWRILRVFPGTSVAQQWQLELAQCENGRSFYRLAAHRLRLWEGDWQDVCSSSTEATRCATTKFCGIL